MTVNKEVTGGAKVSVVVQGQKGKAVIYLVICQYEKGPETSITLEWKTVPNIDKYILAFNEREINISNSENEYRVLNLTSGTRYNVTLFTGNISPSEMSMFSFWPAVPFIHQGSTHQPYL
uniref:Fibronectin type-III domain-containing protein n=1 Tax=Maylandia zebra TaxID=106582 RepID=A0A3P9C7B8_9CICH